MQRPLVAFVCDGEFPMRPFAELLRDRSEHLVLLPPTAPRILRALEQLVPDALVLAGRRSGALAVEIRLALGRDAPLMLGATSLALDDCVTFDERIEAPLTPRKLSELIDRLQHRAAS